MCSNTTVHFLEILIALKYSEAFHLLHISVFQLQRIDVVMPDKVSVVMILPFYFCVYLMHKYKTNIYLFSILDTQVTSCAADRLIMSTKIKKYLHKTDEHIVFFSPYGQVKNYILKAIHNLLLDHFYLVTQILVFDKYVDLLLFV